MRRSDWYAPVRSPVRSKSTREQIVEAMCRLLFLWRSKSCPALAGSCKLHDVLPTRWSDRPEIGCLRFRPSLVVIAPERLRARPMPHGLKQIVQISEVGKMVAGKGVAHHVLLPLLDSCLLVVSPMLLPEVARANPPRPALAAGL